MGTVLKILGGLFLVGVLGFAGLLYWGHQEGQSTQKDFFTAVLSGDPAKVKALFHPDLAAQVDDPLLAAWMQAVKEHLGAFKGMSGSNFNTSVNHRGGQKIVESKGTVEFEKGEAQSNLKFVNGKIVAWEVKSAALPKNWFTKLEDMSFYDKRARAFLETLMRGEAQAALDLMHENLRAKFEPAAFAKGLSGIAERLGTLEGLEELTQDFEAGPPPQVKLRYTVRGSKESAVAGVRFVINGMRGHLMGFGLPEPK